MYNLKSKLLLSQTKIQIDTNVIYSYNGFYVYLSKPNGSLKFMVNINDYQTLYRNSVIYQIVNKMGINIKGLEDEQQKQIRIELRNTKAKDV